MKLKHLYYATIGLLALFIAITIVSSIVRKGNFLVHFGETFKSFTLYGLPWITLIC